MRDALKAHKQWKSEREARTWLLPLSVVSFAIAAGVLWWLSQSSPGCLAATICPTAAVRDVLTPIIESSVPRLVALVLLAYFLTRVFIDYLGDVALYTMAAENSAFVQTRVGIQREFSRQLRHILRDGHYASVAIAGHSLGSVIGYDAIRMLRAEVARDDAGDPSSLTREELAKLTTFVTFGSPLNKVL
jgi:hypothetical protein